MTLIKPKKWDEPFGSLWVGAYESGCSRVCLRANGIKFRWCAVGGWINAMDGESSSSSSSTKCPAMGQVSSSSAMSPAPGRVSQG